MRGKERYKCDTIHIFIISVRVQCSAIAAFQIEFSECFDVPLSSDGILFILIHTVNESLGMRAKVHNQGYQMEE